MTLTIRLPQKIPRPPTRGRLEVFCQSRPDFDCAVPGLIFSPTILVLVIFPRVYSQGPVFVMFVLESPKRNFPNLTSVVRYAYVLVNIVFSLNERFPLFSLNHEPHVFSYLVYPVFFSGFWVAYPISCEAFGNMCGFYWRQTEVF